ncbi:DUF3990 domain-containing protein [Bacillus sp. IITD106]|nr:DUF3990 domain-containing protein [Bacillus sp. IITD106]
MVKQLSNSIYCYKSIDEIPKILYHGTSSNNIESLKKGIILNIGNKKTDFGVGFYLTGNFKQARGWAISRQKAIMENTGETSAKAVIISYEVNHEILKELNYYLFSEANIHWAEFVYGNRALDFNVHHNQDKKYDFVYGPLADGSQITLLVSKLRRKEIDLAYFFEKIKGIKFPFPKDHQMSFHSIKAIKALSIKNIQEVS